MGEKVIEIKGYIRYFKEEIPITWERETKNYVHMVKRVRHQGDIISLDKRLFDDKVHKDEIIADASVFKIPYIRKESDADCRSTGTNL